MWVLEKKIKLVKK